MALTRPPLILIQPVGSNVPGDVVTTDGSRLLVTKNPTGLNDTGITAGSYNADQGVLTLVFGSGKTLVISGFLTSTAVGRGEKGDRGDAGKDGLDGKDGVNGLQGLRGLSGSPGLKGDRGEPGREGSTGERGLQGEQGETGLPGANGVCRPCDSSGSETNNGGTTPASPLPGGTRVGLQDIDADGEMSNLTYLRGDSQWARLPEAVNPLPHQHGLSDLRLTGVGSSLTFLRGDGQWAELPVQAPTAHHHSVADINATGVLSPYTYLRGDGQWAALPQELPLDHKHNVSDINATGVANAVTFLRGDGQWAPIDISGKIPLHVHTVADLVSMGDRNPATFLRGDGSWATPGQLAHKHDLVDLYIDGTASDNVYLCGDGQWSDPFQNLAGSYPAVTDLQGDEVLTLLVGGVGRVGTVDQVNRYRRYGKLQDLPDASGSLVLNLSLADSFNIVLNGDVSISLSSPPTAPSMILIRIKQGGTGNHSISWSNAFKFPHDTAPMIGTAVGDVELFVGQCLEAGRVDMVKADGPF